MKQIFLLGACIFLISSVADSGRFESTLKIGEKIAEEIVKKSMKGGIRVTPGFKPDKQPLLPLKGDRVPVSG